jgi:hypothetical protein
MWGTVSLRLFSSLTLLLTQASVVMVGGSLQTGILPFLSSCQLNLFVVTYHTDVIKKPCILLRHVWFLIFSHITLCLFYKLAYQQVINVLTFLLETNTLDVLCEDLKSIINHDPCPWRIPLGEGR